MCWTENLVKLMQTQLQGPILNAAVARIDLGNRLRIYIMRVQIFPAVPILNREEWLKSKMIVDFQG